MLAIVCCKGSAGVTLSALVQGLGRPLSPELRLQVRQQARILKAIGRIIVDSYGEQLIGETGIHGLQGWLVQKEIARKLSSQLGDLKVGTLVARISKIVNNELVELPSGAVVPISSLFRGKKPGPAGGKDDRDELLFLSQHLSKGPTSLAKDYLRASGAQPGDSKLVNTYQKQFGRHMEYLKQALNSSSSKDTAAIAREFVSVKGMKPDAELISALTEVLDFIRGRDARQS